MQAATIHARRCFSTLTNKMVLEIIQTVRRLECTEAAWQIEKLNGLRVQWITMNEEMLEENRRVYEGSSRKKMHVGRRQWGNGARSERHRKCIRANVRNAWVSACENACTGGKRYENEKATKAERNNQATRSNRIYSHERVSTFASD